MQLHHLLVFTHGSRLSTSLLVAAISSVGTSSSHRLAMVCELFLGLRTKTHDFIIPMIDLGSCIDSLILHLMKVAN